MDRHYSTGLDWRFQYIDDRLEVIERRLEVLELKAMDAKFDRINARIRNWALVFVVLGSASIAIIQIILR